MRHSGQRGTSLIEIAVAIAIIAIAAGAALSAFLASQGRVQRRDARAALEDCVRRELTVAVDILKYSGGAVAPATVATTLPMPGGSPLPAIVSLTTQRTGGAINVEVTAATIDGTQRVASSATLAAQAPLPDTSSFRAGLVAEPSGAP